VLDRDQVLAALRGVMDPELGADVVELGMVRAVSVSPTGVVEVGLALTIAECPMRGQIESLNAAVAGSIVLYLVWQARGVK